MTTHKFTGPKTIIPKPSRTDGPVPVPAVLNGAKDLQECIIVGIDKFSDRYLAMSMATGTVEDIKWIIANLRCAVKDLKKAKRKMKDEDE